MGTFFSLFLFFRFYRYSLFFSVLNFRRFLEKKILIGFGQTADHKTPRAGWVSTCVTILKGNKYKGVGDFNFWPVRLGVFLGKFLLELEWWYSGSRQSWDRQSWDRQSWDRQY